MKQIDFSRLKMEVRIGEYGSVDARKDLGNFIFANASNLETDQLSRKIFNSSNEPVKLDDGEYGMMMNCLRQNGAKYSVIKAIEGNVKDISDENIKTAKKTNNHVDRKQSVENNTQRSD